MIFSRAPYMVTPVIEARSSPAQTFEFGEQLRRKIADRLISMLPNYFPNCIHCGDTILRNVFS